MLALPWVAVLTNRDASTKGTALDLHNSTPRFNGRRPTYLQSEDKSTGYSAKGSRRKGRPRFRDRFVPQATLFGIYSNMPQSAVSLNNGGGKEQGQQGGVVNSFYSWLTYSCSSNTFQA